MAYILEKIGLSVDDVLIRPGRGVVQSSSEIKIEPFIIAAPMDTVTGYTMIKVLLAESQMAIIPRWHEGCQTIGKAEYYLMLRDFLKHPNVFLAVGTTIEELESLPELLANAKVDFVPENGDTLNICIDTAHGFSNYGIAIVKAYRELDCVKEIMSGSIATEEAVAPLVYAGATYLRVGIGPGAACTTRIKTGAGVPQFTAVAEVADRAKLMNLPIKVIADGGIQEPGQACKYIGVGAHYIMMGSVFSRCIESPGWVDNGMYGFQKKYRGQASADYQIEHYGKASACPEGAVSNWFSPDGSTVESVCLEYKTALQRAISYSGYTNQKSFTGNCEFIRITSTGIREGTPHGC